MWTDLIGMTGAPNFTRFILVCGIGGPPGDHCKTTGKHRPTLVDSCRKEVPTQRTSGCSCCTWVVNNNIEKFIIKCHGRHGSHYVFGWLSLIVLWPGYTAHYPRCPWRIFRSNQSSAHCEYFFVFRDLIWILSMPTFNMALVGCGTPCLLGSLGVREVVGSRPDRGNSKEFFILPANW